jgi:hypothetical protein
MDEKLHTPKRVIAVVQATVTQIFSWVPVMPRYGGLEAGSIMVLVDGRVQ